MIHPAIDAAIQLRNQYHLKPDQIASIQLKVNPLVIELTGKKTPQIGLEGKFSIYHSVAVAIVDGAAGEKQYSNSKVQNAQIIAVRDKVTAIIDDNIKPEQVDMTIVTTDGRTLHIFIEHAIGSVEKPMTDAQLEVKFIDLVEDILPPAQVQKLIKLCWNIEQLSSAALIPQTASL